MDQGSGLRERKKARTRAHIAAVAARLFGERGYDNVTVADVGRAAEVATQTVFNYFPTKQNLLLDRAEEVRDAVAHSVRHRPPGTSPAEAVSTIAHAEAEQLRGLTAEQARGGLAALAATSHTIRLLVLEAIDQQAEALAGAILATDPGLSAEVVKVHAVGLAWIFQIILDHTGRRCREGAAPDQVVDELHPIIDALLDHLHHAFETLLPSARPTTNRRAQ